MLYTSPLPLSTQQYLLRSCKHRNRTFSDFTHTIRTVHGVMMQGKHRRVGFVMKNNKPQEKGRHPVLGLIELTYSTLYPRTRTGRKN